MIRVPTRLALTGALAVTLAACFDFNKDFQTYCDETGACVCESPGVEAKLSFNPGLVEMRAGTCTPIRVQVLDGKGCVTALRGAGTRLTLGDRPATLQFFANADCSGAPVENASIDLPGGARETTFSLLATRPGTPTLGARAVLDSELFVSQLPVTIRPGEPALLKVTEATQDYQAGACGGPILAQVQDGLENLVTQDAPITVRTSSDAGTFFEWLPGTEGGCGEPLDTVVARGGLLRLGYRDERAGTHQLTFSLPPTDAGIDLAANVTHAAPVALVPLHGPQRTLGTGTCTEVTVERRDAFGNPVPDAKDILIATTVDVTLTGIGGGPSSDALLYATKCGVDGQTALTLTIDQARATLFLQGSAAQRGEILFRQDPLSTAVDFELLDAPSLALRPLEAPVSAGACARLSLHVVPEAAAPQAQGRPVQFASMDGNLKFFAAEDATCTSPLPGSAATLSAQGEVQLRVRSERAGSFGFTASVTGTPPILPLTGDLTVEPGPPVALHVPPGVHTVTAGACGSISVGARDPFGNAAPLAGSPTFSTGAEGPRTSWFADPLCSEPLSSDKLHVVGGLATLATKLTGATSFQVTFQASGLLPAARQWTVVPAAPASITLDPGERRSAPGDTKPFTANLRDAFGNASTTPGELTLHPESAALTFGTLPGGTSGELRVPAGMAFLELYATTPAQATPGAALPFSVGASGLEAGTATVLVCAPKDATCTIGGDACCPGTTCGKNQKGLAVCLSDGASDG